MRRSDLQKKHQERALLKKVKKQPEWKAKKANKSINDKSSQSIKEGTGQFKSQLERIYEKDQRIKGIEKVKKEARKEMSQKNKLSKNISKVIMNKIKK